MTQYLRITLSSILFLATIATPLWAQERSRASRQEATRSYTGSRGKAPVRMENIHLHASEDRSHRQALARPQPAKSKGNPITLPNQVPAGKEVILAPTVTNAFGTIALTSDLPPNTDFAVSGNGLMVTVDNDYLGIWDTDGNEILVETWIDFFNDLGAPLGAEILYPKVTLDPISGRFLVAVNYGDAGNNSSLFVLVSDSDDPSLGWTVYEFFSSDWGESGTLNNLSMGLSTEELFVAADVLNSSLTQVDAIIYQVSLTDMFGGGGAEYLFYQDFLDFDNQLGNHLHATQYDYNELVGPGMYFVSRTLDFVLLWDITSSIDDLNTQLDLYEYSVESYTFKDRVNQPGSSDQLYSGNGQITDAFYANDYLYLVHSAVDPGTGRQGAVMWEVDALSDQITGWFYGTSAYDMAFPSLCMVGQAPSQPEFFLSYLYASENHYPGMGAAFIGTDGTTGGLVETAKGIDPVNLNTSESLEYWGTYSGMVRQHASSQTTRYWQLGVVAENGGYVPVANQLEVGNVDLPEAGFTTANTVGPGPLTVSFSGTTDTNPATSDWQWVFEGGDLASSTSQSVSVTYADTGRFDVTLIVTNGAGYDTLVSPDLVHVTALSPTADFSASATAGDFPLTVQFTDQSTYVPTSWSWAFEGGTPSASTAQNPEVVYNTPGTYQVSLTVANEAGSNAKTREGYITVNRPELTADFTSGDPSGSIPLTVQFADASGGFPVAWEWTFLGGTPSSSTAETPSVTYSAVGEYEVKLVVTNEIGDRDSITRTNYVRALPPPPTVAFQASDSAGTAPFTVQFTDLSTESPTAWQWEFPGGTPSSSTEQNPTVTYSTGGSFSVTLRASNAGGSNSLTANNLIEVTVIPPEAAFAVSDPDGIAPFTVTFTDQSTNAPTGWQWNFPGGTPSTSAQQNPTVTYSTAGTFDATLVVSNAAGNDALTRNAIVSVEYVTPIADFSSDVTSGPAPLTVFFSDESEFAPQSFNWSFPGGTPESSTESNPSVTYDTPGTYAVTLAVSNEAGSDTLLRSGHIVVREPLPVVDFSADVRMGEGPLTVVFDNLTTGAVSYAWEFTGGNPRRSTEESPTVVFEAVGSWAVQLTAGNGDGGTDTHLKPNFIVVTAITGIEDADEESMMVYPNPSTGAITVRLAEIPTGAVQLRLYNTLGQPIRQQHVPAVAGKEIAWLLSDVSEGMYVLEVISERQRLGQTRLLLRP